MYNIPRDTVLITFLKTKLDRDYISRVADHYHFKVVHLQDIEDLDQMNDEGLNYFTICNYNLAKANIGTFATKFKRHKLISVSPLSTVVDANIARKYIFSHIYFPIEHHDLLSCLTSVEKSTGLQTQAGDTAKLSGRILVAEDNRTNQLVIKSLLEKRGLEVSIANNGLEAIEMCRTMKFDLVLMDAQMPELDGVESTKRIREFDPRLPIVALTANVQPEAKVEFNGAGVNDFLTKPIVIEKLDLVLRAYLGTVT